MNSESRTEDAMPEGGDPTHTVVSVTLSYPADVDWLIRHTTWPYTDQSERILGALKNAVSKEVP